MSDIKKSNYMNPYIAGVLLGLVVIAANFISGRSVGASGAIKNAIVAGVETIAPAHAESASFYKEFAKGHSGNPLNSWLVYQMLGVIVGGFLSGVISKRLTWKVEHNPHITSRTRLIFALVGGVLFGVGSQFGRGCTSGSALSGMAVLSLGGFISMMAIFGTAFAFAYFFRKLWI
jgi:uncharacterized protein